MPQKGAYRIMTKTLMYTQVGDYLLPNINTAPQENLQAVNPGHYAKMRKAFLKEHRTINYNRLLLTEKLYPHLMEVEEAANRRLKQVMSALLSKAKLPSKETDSLGWTAAMNSLKAQAEEIVTNELIYT